MNFFSLFLQKYIHNIISRLIIFLYINWGDQDYSSPREASDGAGKGGIQSSQK